MRQVATISRAIATPDDFAGMKIRVPPGQMMIDTFSAFGAKTGDDTRQPDYDALQTGKVEAQENPLAILEGFKLYELVKYVSLTNHMWSGFNAMANLATWKSLPDDIKGIIERNSAKYVRAQRTTRERCNTALRQDFVKRGLRVQRGHQAAFRARLPAVYAAWKERLGSRCWTLVEAEVGKLG